MEMENAGSSADLSIIVPARNNADVIGQGLRSIETALDFYRQRLAGSRPVVGEVIVVDDGSQDGTGRLAEEFARDRPHWKVVRNPSPSNAACARNLGVACTRGELLFFLDGDDLYYENHIYECAVALQEGSAQFVKTGVALSDPVHPDWRPRIRNSLVLNLGVRRRCHELIGGFPDYQLCRRGGDLSVDGLDVYARIEDVYYNRLLQRFFTGVAIGTETVRYIRYPGNSFDRQYAKFLVPPHDFASDPDGDRRLQIDIAESVYRHLVDRVERSLARLGEGRRPTQ